MSKAKKIPAGSYLFYEQEQRSSKMNIKSGIVIGGIFAVWVVSWCLSPVLFSVMFGMTFIITAFNDLRLNVGNVLEVGSSIWKRVPYVWAGAAFIIIGISINAELENDNGLYVFFTSLKWYFLCVFLMMAVRLIHNMICAIEISKRKTDCTEYIYAKYNEFTGNEKDREDNEFYKGVYDSFSEKDRENMTYYHRVYREYGYEYGAWYYKIMVSDQVTDKLENNDGIELYIDPQCPERYYTEWLVKGNRKNFKAWAMVMGFWVVAAAVVWWFASLGY